MNQLLADLVGLLELEAQEGGARVRGERAIVPMDVFEGLVPAWIQAPATSDLDTLSPALRAFLEGFDGRTSLRRLSRSRRRMTISDPMPSSARRRNRCRFASATTAISRTSTPRGCRASSRR